MWAPVENHAAVFQAAVGGARSVHGCDSVHAVGELTKILDVFPPLAGTICASNKALLRPGIRRRPLGSQAWGWYPRVRVRFRRKVTFVPRRAAVFVARLSATGPLSCCEDTLPHFGRQGDVDQRQAR